MLTVTEWNEFLYWLKQFKPVKFIKDTPTYAKAFATYDGQKTYICQSFRAKLSDKDKDFIYSNQ